MELTKRGSKRIRVAQEWLTLVRSEGGSLSDKRRYLAEKGFSEEALDYLMRWEREQVPREAS